MKTFDMQIDYYKEMKQVLRKAVSGQPLCLQTDILRDEQNNQVCFFFRYAMTSQEVKLLLLILDFGERVIVKTAHILWIKSVFMSIPDIFKLRCKKKIYI